MYVINFDETSEIKEKIEIIREKGYIIQRFRGQTYINLCEKDLLNIKTSKLIKLIESVFSNDIYKQAITRSKIIYLRDSINLDLPTIYNNEVDNISQKNKNKIFDENPSIIFPDFFLPNKLIELIFKESNKQIDLENLYKYNSHKKQELKIVIK